MTEAAFPRAYTLRRLHSLTGIFLSLFLIQHLFVNSQAALYFGDDGKGFINAVNSIQSMPYLYLIEIGVLAVPFLIHIIVGVQIIRTASYNSFKTDGSTPSLGFYKRNRAFTWQRITAWILVIGVLAHIVHMRFIEYPKAVQEGRTQSFIVSLQNDPGLASVSDRLGVQLYTPEEIKQNSGDSELSKVLFSDSEKGKDIIAKAPDFGTAELLVVREAFKSPFLMALYALFVLIAVFHAYNGLWSFCIRWGITLSPAAQQRMLKLCVGLMCFVAFLGLVSIFGTYWINLKQ